MLVTKTCRKKYIHISQMKDKSYRLGITWQWVNNGRIFICVWKSLPLVHWQFLCFCQVLEKHYIMRNVKTFIKSSDESLCSMIQCRCWQRWKLLNGDWLQLFFCWHQFELHCWKGWCDPALVFKSSLQGRMYHFVWVIMTGRKETSRLLSGLDSNTLFLPI